MFRILERRLGKLVIMVREISGGLFEPKQFSGSVTVIIRDTNLSLVLQQLDIVHGVGS